jgi:hypothetical protein
VGSRLRLLSRTGFVASAAALACSLALPAIALASPVDNVWAAARVSLEKSPKGVPTMAVSGTLGKTVTLPAAVAFAVPSGAKITWVGEVFPDGGGQDAKVGYRVERNAAAGWDRVVFTIRRSRYAQVEMAVPGAIAAQGAKELAKVTWTPLGGVPVVGMAINLPAGSKVETGTPGGRVVQGATGPTYAASSSGAIPAGVTLSLSVLYVPGAPAATVSAATGRVGAGSAPAKAQGGSAPLLAAVVILAGVVGYLVVTRRKGPAAADGSGGEDAPVVEDEREPRDGA